MQKRYLILLLNAILFFPSCTETFYVTKNSTFKKTVADVNSQLSNDGYKIVGSTSEVKNNLYAEKTSYSKYTGYGTKMENNFITRDTYSFADSIGNKMNYSVEYSAKRSEKGVNYVENVEVCGCETSNPLEYEKLCGKGSEIYRINTLPKDQPIQTTDVANTTLAVTGITIALTLVLTLVLIL